MDIHVLGRRAAAITLLALVPSACVRVEAYDDAVAQLQQVRGDAKQLGAIVAQLQQEVAKLQADVRARDAKLADLGVARANDQKRIDDLVALNEELSQRLKAVGQSVEALSGEKGALAKALADTRARLDELRKREAAAEARAAQFRDLAARFQKMVDAGQLKVVMRNGRMILELPNDVLFDSGRAEVKEDGRRTIAQIGGVLRTMEGRRFQVAGHTDNVKINTARFPSNWELSTARAVEVVQILVGAAMDPKSLSAAGYGEFDPIASNDAPEGRGRNRRIEITLVPNLEELVAMPDPAKAPPPAPQAPQSGPVKW